MPLKHRGYGAYITCDGRELEQFKVKVESDKIVSCYVPGDTGTDYKVHWVDSKPPTHLSVEVRTDGRRIGVVSHTKGSSKTTHPGLRVPLDTNCSSKFLHVPSVDDALPAAYSEEIGTIEIRLRRVRDFIAVPFRPKPSAPSGPRGRPGNTNSPSNSKGPTKSASVGSKKENQPKPTVLRPILIDDKPYVVFRFFYRPSEVLEANGVKPSGHHKPNKSVPVPPASRRRKRASGEVPSNLPAEEEPQQPPSKRRRPASEIPEQLEPEVVPSGSHYEDDEMYLDVGHNAADQDNVYDDTVGDVKASRRRETSDMSRPSPPIPGASAMDISEDGELEEERLVEVHLSSRNGFALPASSGCGSTFRTPNPIVKRESTPAPVKREPSPEAPGAIGFWPDSTGEVDVKPKIEECGSEEESVVEVHLNSRNQHVVFGTEPGRHCIKEEIVKQEDCSGAEQTPILDRAGSPIVKHEEEDVVVEVHISSRDIQRALDVARSAGSVKAEPTRD
ncbi:hypothetical protein VTO73DRAFT_13626 [Trametes versicolor]